MTAEHTPDGANLFVPAEAVLNCAPDVVVGHDRISGSVAWIYVRKYLPAALVHIVHTAPPEIEPYKGRTGATLRVEVRERVTQQLASAARVVAAVGPRLTRHADAVVGDGFWRRFGTPARPGMTVPKGAAAHVRKPLKPSASARRCW